LEELQYRHILQFFKFKEAAARAEFEKRGLKNMEQEENKRMK
jgi:hypothetical protein